MAFTPIVPMSPGGNALKLGVVKMSASRNNNQLAITVSCDIAGAIGSPEYVRVYLGDGPDRNTLLIEPAPEKGAGAFRFFPANKSATQRKLAFNRRVAGIEAVFGSTAASHRITDEGLIIELPLVARPKASFSVASIEANASAA